MNEQMKPQLDKYTSYWIANYTHVKKLGNERLKELFGPGMWKGSAVVQCNIIISLNADIISFMNNKLARVVAHSHGRESRQRCYV